MEHMHKLIERYHSTLAEMIKEGISEGVLFDIMYEMYQSSEILIKLAVDKFILNKLVTPQGIVKGAFKHLKENILNRSLWIIITQPDSPIFNEGRAVFTTIIEEWVKMADEIKGVEDKAIMQDYLLYLIYTNRKISKENAKEVHKLMSIIGLNINSFPL
jgi:hypothetical protein